MTSLTLILCAKQNQAQICHNFLHSQLKLFVYTDPIDYILLPAAQNTETEPK